MTTQTHDSTTCRAGKDGGPCEMCLFAKNSAQKRVESPSLTYYGHPRLDTEEVGFLEPEAKNVSGGDSGPVEAISAPDFEREWNAATPARRRYTEQSEAEHWFQRGLWLGIQYERERGLLAMNSDLREMQRLARERVGR